MQRAEHEMAGLGGGDGELDGLQVAHFPDHDDVGVFAERAAEGVAEGLGVRVDFALGDVAVARVDDVFDRVFERDDVVVALLVDVIDHRGQRRGFARADGARHEDEAVVVFREHLHDLGEAEVVHGAQAGADDAEDEIHPEPVPHDGCAEAPELIRVGEVDVAALCEHLLLLVVEEAHREPLGVRRGEEIGLEPDGFEHAEAPPDGEGIHAEMHIRAAAFLAELEVLIDVLQRVDFAAAGAGRGCVFEVVVLLRGCFVVHGKCGDESYRRGGEWQGKLCPRRPQDQRCSTLGPRARLET